MPTPLVTIAVPIYNVKECLPALFASLEAQSFSNFECILVDDGSSDGSGAVCDDQVRRDARFSVIHQKNAGVCSARNAGIRAAKGRFVVLCDQDDQLAPRTLEWALAEQQAHPDQLIVWPFTRSPEAFAAQPGFYSTTCFGRGETLRYFASDLFIYVWNKLLPTEVLRAMPALFTEGMVGGGEDFDFMARFLPAFFALHPGGGVRQIEAPLYYWNLENEKSVSKWQGNHAHYCQKQFAFFNRVKSAFAPFYEQEPRQIAQCMNRILRPVVFGLTLAKQNGEPASECWQSPELAEMLDWLRQNRWYTDFYLPLRLRCAPLARAMLRWQEQRPALYWKCYWLGYYLLARGWQRL